jgi:beta-glucosidase
MAAWGQRGHPPLALNDGFIWATGIEDTFISEPHPTTGRTLDEYELTEHYDRWEEDLQLIADLGVNAARYGIPWYRVCPQPGKYDWSWTDKVLDRMANTHGIEPIIDLVHYGTPQWMDQSFFNPDYPQHVADYAHAFAERYKSLVYWYTPLNEPRVNAWYAGRLGWWPPYAKSWRGFVRLMTQLCKGICLTEQAIRTVESRAVLVHVDATDLYIPANLSDAGVVAEAYKRQEIVFLALDLVMGRLGEKHPLREWLNAQGLTDTDILWFADHAAHPDIIGYNMYPMFSQKIVARVPAGGIRVRIKPCWAETLANLTHMYAARYAPIPIMVTETATAGSIKRRKAWIEDSVAVINKARAGGANVVGYTLWPLFSLVTWAYRNGKADASEYLIDMGLWDLRPGPQGLERLHTPLVDVYKSAIAATANPPTSAS